MADTVDSAAVRKSLDSARGQRTQITRGAPLPIDTAHVVGACPKCGLLGATILGFPDPPYAGPQGQPRYRNARELQRFIEEIFKNPPPLPAPEDPSENRRDPQDPRRTVPAWKGVCRCGAKVLPPQPDQRTGQMVSDPEATPRRVCGVRFIKAMPGSGAELVLEALSPEAGSQPFSDDAAISFRVLRAPLDGVETEVSTALDDDAIEHQFGRPLTLAETWRKLLARAAAGADDDVGRGQPVLRVAEGLADEAPHAIAGHGVADHAGCNGQAQTGSGLVIGTHGHAEDPVAHAPTLLVGRFEISLATDPLCGGERQRRGAVRVQGLSFLRPLARRRAMILRPLAVAMRARKP